MDDFLHSAVNALLFGAGWGVVWAALVVFLLATSPPRLSEGRTEAHEAEDDNPHPAHPPTIDGEARRL